VRFSVISSGSKANSLYIRTDKTQVLVDCGLSCKEAVRRLKNIGVEPAELNALVVSHEHEDHIAGVRVLANKFDLPVYLTEPSLNASYKLQQISLHRILFFEPYVTFMVGDLIFSPFKVPHDAAQSVGFKISDGKSTLALITDLGDYDELILSQSYDCDALILESNYEESDLWISSYPWELKERISGGLGHLGNERASKFIWDLQKRGAHRRLKLLGAAHVSENSNSPDKALQAIKSSCNKFANQPYCFVASPHESTELFSI